MRKIIKTVSIILLSVVGLVMLVALGLVGYGAYLYASADMKRPDIKIDMSDYQLSVDTDSLRVCNGNSLLLNKSDVWEMRVGGDAVERGAAMGVMSHSLLDYQEQVFVDQINRMIPSQSYVRLLYYLIIIFNHDIACYIPQEYRNEIYAIAQSCNHRFDMFGEPYTRQLNYHAAHDIGHTMQEYMLVGCSSFAVWGDESADSGLLVGRNFDFYMGDDFARNKLILFVTPDTGFAYASVCWPGMIGVLSGMNEKGLTVTINAAKGPVPTASAMPISLLARHILQYASDIDEAVAIADTCHTFVSESLLIGSARDGCAAVIEKTPSHTALRRSDNHRIICTNHYLSEDFADDTYNRENIASSDSPYRYARIAELLQERMPLDPTSAVTVLRDRKGLNDSDIGLANEKSINQYIGHHSVVFQPGRLKMWVSTSPWQAGEFVCYDLHKVFEAAIPVTLSLASTEQNIAADTEAVATDCRRVMKYRQQMEVLRTAISGKSILPDEYLDEVVSNNPEMYEVYNMCGDYLEAVGRTADAVSRWRQALDREIPRTGIRQSIEQKIERNENRQ